MGIKNIYFQKRDFFQFLFYSPSFKAKGGGQEHLLKSLTQKSTRGSPSEFLSYLVKMTSPFQGYEFILLQLVKDVCPLMFVLNGKSYDDDNYICVSGFQKSLGGHQVSVVLH